MTAKVVPVLIILCFTVAAYGAASVLRKTSDGGTPGTVCRDCNVILISIEALRPEHMQVFGYPRNTTPFLADYFGDGTVFTRAYSSSSCTNPSVLQFLTGQFDHNGGVSLAEVLKANGYRTAAVASQHMFGWGNNPKGEYFGGFDYFSLQENDRRDQHDFTNRTADEVTDIAVSWLDAHGLEGKFFLWLHIYDPHDPYNPPEDYRLFASPNGRYDYSGDVRTYLKEGRETEYLDWRTQGQIFSPEDIRYFNDLYDGEILFVDDQIQRLFQKLDDLGLPEKSVVVVTADHGERLGEENTWDHCQTLHEMEIHVPLLFSVGGKRLCDYGIEDRIVSTLDIYPTVLNLVGVKEFGYTDGVNLGDMPDDRLVYSVFWENKAIMYGDYKLQYNNGSSKLFNVVDDPLQNSEVGEENKQLKEFLIDNLLNFLRSDRRGESEDEEVKQRLKAIGYL